MIWGTDNKRPPEVQRSIISHLSPLDIVNYGTLNKETHAIVNDFQRAAFKVENVLRPFFSVDEIRRFRQVQYAYKFLISGSTALSFFTREVYDNADLDVYITPKSLMVLILLLESMGYAFCPIINPSRTQAGQVENAVEELLVRIREGTQRERQVIGRGTEDWSLEYSFAKELVDVFNFERNGRRIQVIAALSPLAVVLTFHSTVVMNIISHSHAISFYPRLTFHDRIAVRNFLSRECPEDTITKYQTRGYTFHYQVDAATAFAGRYSSLETHVVRRPADVYCWTVPLGPIPGVKGLDFKPELLLQESWQIKYDTNRHFVLVVDFDVILNRFEDPRTTGYCFADRVVRHIPDWWVDDEDLNIDSWPRNLLRQLTFANSRAEEDEMSTEDFVTIEFKKAMATISAPREKFPYISHVQQIPWLLRWLNERIVLRDSVKVTFHFEQSGENGDVYLKIKLTVPDDTAFMSRFCTAISVKPQVRKCLKAMASGRISVEFRTDGFSLFYPGLEHVGELSSGRRSIRTVDAELSAMLYTIMQ
ncbi:hypothetical protein E1B28_012981 [Marasmius oreades]|uniref:F-box domain-containing protein n=1 Tax=Marasmius oreades TaxID=181124 RepID=A0A9P7ULF6_9AGAR|nr:uncharacterized protein E1B28_012981 [Marasmius oreades]KAG7087002.1 hypothetical protein E1B28_012981 [Marasmius oreades]